MSLALNNPKPDAWHKIIEAYKKTVENGQKVLEAKAKSKDTLWCFDLFLHILILLDG